MARTPASVYQAIRDAYLRYVDTAYWLRNPALMAERRLLLEQRNAVFTDVLLEPVLPYDAEIDLSETVQRTGLHPRLGDSLDQPSSASTPTPGAHPTSATPSRGVDPVDAAWRCARSERGGDIRDRVRQDGILPAARLARTWRRHSNTLRTRLLTHGGWHRHPAGGPAGRAAPDLPLLAPWSCIPPTRSSRIRSPASEEPSDRLQLVTIPCGCGSAVIRAPPLALARRPDSAGEVVASTTLQTRFARSSRSTTAS